MILSCLDQPHFIWFGDLNLRVSLGPNSASASVFKVFIKENELKFHTKSTQSLYFLSLCCS